MPVLLKFPNSYENEYEIWMRGQAFKKQIREFLSANPLPEGEKMAVVCHSMFICTLTGSHCDKVDDNGQDDTTNYAIHNYKWLNNCQTIGWSNY